MTVPELGYHLCWCAATEALDAYARALWEHGIDLRGIWYPDDGNCSHVPV